MKRSGNQLRLEAPNLTLEGPAPAWLANGQRLAAVLPRARATIREQEVPSEANQLAGVIQRCVFTGSQYDIHVRTDHGLNIQVSAGPHAFAPPRRAPASS